MHQEIIREDSVAEPRRAAASNTLYASCAALVSLLAASTCCLPMLPFMVAAGMAGGSAFLTTLRPYLLAGAILCIACGFYQAWRAKKCNRRPRVLNSVLLWISAVFVFVSVFFPQLMANTLADLLVH